jgi:mannitol operon transcriptional antiterminator
MVEISGQMLGTSFKDDQDLVRGLITHIRPMLERIRFDIAGVMADPGIKTNYPVVFHATEFGAKAIEEMLGITIPPREISYLALYIGAAVERQNSGRQTRPVRALLLCGSGLGTVQMLKQRVLNAFPHFEIWDTCSIDELDDFAEKGIDLCLSTVPVRHPAFHVIPCSPFLGMTDIETIKNWLDNGQKGRGVHEVITDEIVRLASRLGMHHRDFRKEVNKYFSKKRIDWNRPEDYQANRKEDLKVLTDLLTLETVSCIDGCPDWTNAVYAGGDLLQKIGGIESKYNDAVIQALQKHGPYMVIAPGIALLHARPEDGVNQVCMSLQILRSGVRFGHKDRDPVRLVFMFGTTDPKSHLQALSELMNLINDEPLLDALRASQTAAEAVEVLQQLRKKYHKEE